MWLNFGVAGPSPGVVDISSTIYLRVCWCLCAIGQPPGNYLLLKNTCNTKKRQPPGNHLLLIKKMLVCFKLTRAQPGHNVVLRKDCYIFASFNVIFGVFGVSVLLSAHHNTKVSHIQSQPLLRAKLKKGIWLYDPSHGANMCVL